MLQQIHWEVHASEFYIDVDFPFKRIFEGYLMWICDLDRKATLVKPMQSHESSVVQGKIF